MNEEGSMEEFSGNVKSIKKKLYMEEALSAALAASLGTSVAYLIFFPFSFFSVLNIVACYFILRYFRLTVKKQIMFHKYLELLNKTDKKSV